MLGLIIRLDWRGGGGGGGESVYGLGCSAQGLFGEGGGLGLEAVRVCMDSGVRPKA